MKNNDICGHYIDEPREKNSKVIPLNDQDSPDSNILGATISAFSVIIPAYNEEDMIAEQIGVIRDVLSSQARDYEIIVVDDGSTDDTAQKVITTGVRLLQHPENRGYVPRLRRGFWQL